MDTYSSKVLRRDEQDFKMINEKGYCFGTVERL